MFYLLFLCEILWYANIKTKVVITIFIELTECKLCPRQCNANRLGGKAGFCGADDKLKIARSSLHFWEEPCISGEKGSGTVFFSGCTLGCVFCQNYDISNKSFGKEITIARLAKIFLELQEKAALNINLVTPTHYVYHIIEAIKLARINGLKLPIIYNTSGYETVPTIKLLSGYVDVYLPDFKYMNADYAKEYSEATNYVENIKLALAEMVAQVGECVFDDHGIIQKGVIVRHLMLPTLLEDSKAVIEYIYKTYGDRVFLSIMNQYTPFGNLDDFPHLKQKLTQKEYDSAIDYAISLGLENGFIQEGETANESFIPLFDLEGV
ncbi:MAG: radical SAM protein [Oscillospiraceae bacterium]